MTTIEPLPPRLNDLLSALCENTIKDHDFDELQQQLASDPALMRAYLNYLDLHASLPRQFSAILPTNETDLVQVTAPPVQAAVRRSFWMTSSSMIAACLVAIVFYGGFVLLAWNLRPDPSSPSRQSVATLFAIAGAAWNQTLSDKPLHEDRAIDADEVLELTSGQAQLTFASGARVLLEGPCKFLPENSGRGRLEHGKLMAVVPAQAIGFTIATPTIEIVDLGTEFGVEADAKGQTNVEVFQGKVDVNYLSNANVAQAPRRTLRINAGQAKQFSQRDTDREITVVDVSPGMKTRLATPALKAVQKESPEDTSARYAAAVMADHPLAYWRLTDGETGIAADASGNGNNGSYKGSMRSHQPSMWFRSGNRSVRFFGRDAPGWLEMKDVEIPASFTAELWARSATPEWNSYGWLISSPGPAGFLITPNAHSRDWGFHLLAEGKDPIVGTVVGYHQPEKVHDRFHHYVTVYDAESNRGWLCFDGAEVFKADNVLQMRRREGGAKNTLWIGTYFTDNLGNLGDGWVDEIAIYGRTLSAKEIRRHFDAAGVDEMAPKPTSRTTDGGQ